ncbi:hypothetical protein KDK95_34300 [Actinospica sp. MGRD01-02]|uniref:Lipoprotein n=1 Tax=Actinospica acidithermotolerans TaxID=2828514 RepID=A0A941EEY0_9ACTN|nr:hypothetical protein [Actinospica acidithermotolerans]MBR7831425.1 hypothetical protein [Actinospica acidithermotolerans]
MGTKPLRAVGGLAGVTLLTAAALAGCSNNGGLSASSGTRSGGAGSASAGTSAAAGPSASANSTATPSNGTGPGSSAAIPTAAWIPASAIPLYAHYHWSSPSRVAKSVKAPVLSAVQDCQVPLSSSDQAELGAFPAAQAELAPTTGATGGEDDWAAQETILATNDTDSGDVQGVYNLYTDLVADLAKCANTASGAKVTVALSQGAEYAATITVPTSTGSTMTWHEYLAAPYGYLVELSVYVAPYAGDKPGASWDGTSAATVLSSLQSGPCSVTNLC